MSVEQTKEFLEAFHGSEHINFRVIKAGQKPFNLNGLYNDYMIDKLDQLNQQGYDIYFVVNSGGTKQADINKINAVFVDFDCGRDKDKQYYPLDVVEQYKQEKIQIVNQFQYKPSYIVETRNGIHVYWLVEDGATIEQFLQCQLQLIDYFNSDKAVKTQERVMRVPSYYWTKDIDNRFMCGIMQDNGDCRYDINDIMDCLPKIDITEVDTGNTTSKAIIPEVKPKGDNLEFIRNLDVESMRKALYINVSDEGDKGGTIDKGYIPYSIVPPKTPYAQMHSTSRLQPLLDSKTVSNRNEMYDTINRIDMIEFLGLDSNYFNCIFHDDNSKSASIFINPDTGHYLYKCHSSNCKFPAGTITTVVERLAKCNKPQAINFVKEVYGIELIETEWQIEQKAILQANKDYLYSNKMKEEYPELYRRLRNYFPLLIMIHDIAIDNVYDEPFGDDDKVVFFASIRYIQSLMERGNLEKINDRMNLFAFLELLEKLDESQIPEKLLTRAKHEAAKKKQTRLTSYYSIPSYDYSQLSKAENNATIFKDNNMTMRGWSRELLIRTFDEETADRVYPQLKGQKLNKASDKFANTITKLIMKQIDKRGYATESDCLKLLKGNKDHNKTKLKRVLQEILDNYNLQRIRANKKLKQKYGMTGNGYPFIIIKG